MFGKWIILRPDNPRTTRTTLTPLLPPGELPYASGLPSGLPASPLPGLYPWFLYPLSSVAPLPPLPFPPLYNGIFGFGGAGLGLITGEGLIFFAGLFTLGLLISFASSRGFSTFTTGADSLSSFVSSA